MDFLIGGQFIDGQATLLLLPPHALVAFYYVVYRLNFGSEGVKRMLGTHNGVL